jgi:hypothetical protein
MNESAGDALTDESDSSCLSGQSGEVGFFRSKSRESAAGTGRTAERAEAARYRPEVASSGRPSRQAVTPIAPFDPRIEVSAEARHLAGAHCAPSLGHRP